jgi:hypothetical protein
LRADLCIPAVEIPGRSRWWPAAKLDFLDVRIADGGDFFLVHRLAVRIADELAFDLSLDVGLVFFEHEVARRLAGTEARQRGLLLKVLGDGVKGLVHGLRVHFHPQQFLARGQIFDGDVHNNSRWSASRAA